MTKQIEQLLDMEARLFGEADAASRHANIGGTAEQKLRAERVGALLDDVIKAATLRQIYEKEWAREESRARSGELRERSEAEAAKRRQNDY